MKDVPANSTAVGIPARIVDRGAKKAQKFDCDQMNIPDPVFQELCQLKQRIAQLENKVNGSEDKDVNDEQ